jgi:hypothetical protein
VLAATGFAELFFHPDVFPSYSPCLHATRRIYNVLRVTQHTAHNTHHVAFSKANDTLCRTHHFTRITSYITRHIRHTHHFPRITQDSTRLASHSKLHTLHNFSRITHHASQCISHGIRRMPPVTCQTSQIAQHTHHATQITSHGRRRGSPATRITHQISRHASHASGRRRLRPLLRLIPTFHHQIRRSYSPQASHHTSHVTRIHITLNASFRAAHVTNHTPQCRRHIENVIFVLRADR